MKTKKGKILKIKSGYNPNSSSVGSQIPYLFYFVGTIGVISVFVMNYFNKYRKEIEQTIDRDREDDEK